MYSADCLIASLGFKSIPVFVIRDIIIIMNPIMNWLVFLVLYRLIMRKRVSKGVMINSFSFMLYFYYPQIIKSIFPSIIKQKYEEINYV